MAKPRQRASRSEQPKANHFKNIREVVAKSALQKEYLESIGDNTLTFGVGPAGTGKTFLAVYQALCHLWAKKCRRIVISRPVIEAGEKLGFLPGDLNMKMDPFIRPIMDSMVDIIGFDEMKLKMEKGIIEIAPLAFMRGRTFNDAFIILDESQNCTYEQLKMAVTRLGHNSKCVINGDPAQSDLPNSGLKAIIEALTPVKDVGVVHFTVAEVERSEIVKNVVSALEHYEDEIEHRQRRPER